MFIAQESNVKCKKWLETFYRYKYDILLNCVMTVVPLTFLQQPAADRADPSLMEVVIGVVHDRYQP